MCFVNIKSSLYFTIITVIFFSVCKRVKGVIGGNEVACASHCVDGEPGSYQLQLNNYCVDENQMFPRSLVHKIIKHPQYNPFSRAHDIAVLRVNFDSYNISWLNNTILPNSSFGISGDCTVYGYGYKHVGDEKTSEKLLEANLHLISLDECTRLLGPYVAPKYDCEMLCALGDGTDTCQGDSGGPLICAEKLQGICSYGLSCGVKSLPGVYTSIGPHLQWLRDMLNT